MHYLLIVNKILIYYTRPASQKADQALPAALIRIRLQA